MKKRILVLLAVLALMVACMVFTASADAYDWTSAFDGTQECPHCNAVIEEEDWVEYTDSTSFVTNTHYMISSDLDLTANNNSGAKKVVIWIKEGVTVETQGAYNAFRANDASGEVWLLGGANSAITGPGALTASANRNGALLRVISSGKMYIGGGLTIGLNGTVEDVVDGETTTKYYAGGVIDVNTGTLYMKGGTINAIINNGTGETYGAVVVSGKSGIFDMSGGTINGLTAKKSPVYMYAAGTANISGGTINGSTNVAYGGAVYAGTGTVNISGTAIIQNGQATSGGGNLYAVNGGHLNITGGTIQGGSAPRGGNIYTVYSSSAGKLTIAGGTIQNGTATDEAAATGMLEDLDPTGGNIWVGRACTANISAGTIQNGTAANGAGGNIGARGNVNISGTAQLIGGTALQGGNIYCYDCNTITAAGEITSAKVLYGKLNISGGTINGGTATAGNGGAIYVNGAGLTLAAGTYDEVTVGDYSKTEGFNITGGTIYGGQATSGSNTQGGCIWTNYTTATISGATIYDGQATKGGNIAVLGGSLTMDNTSVYNGDAFQGGNLFGFAFTTLNANTNIYGGDALTTMNAGNDESNCGGGNVYFYQNQLKLDSDTAKIYNGNSNGNGGNIYAGGGAAINLNFLSGEVYGGYAAENGGNIYANGANKTTRLFALKGKVYGGEAAKYADNVYVTGGINLTIDGGTIETSLRNEDQAVTKAGSALFATGGATVKLMGDTQICYRNSYNVRLDADANLLVDTSFTGKVFLYTLDRLAAPVYGMPLTSKTEVVEEQTVLAASGTTRANGTYAGQLLLEGTTELGGGVAYRGTGVIPYGEDLDESDDAASYELYVATTSVITEVDGETTTAWYATMADAVEVANGATDKFISLIKDETDMTIAEGKEVFVNLAAHNADVTNNGVLKVFDKSADPSKAATGVLTYTGTAPVVDVNAPDGKLYISLDDNGTVSIHELTLEITGVSLRASATDASLYYTAEIKADDTLWAALSRAGVAVTLKDDAATLATDYMFTDEYAKGVGTFHGVLVSGIVSETNALAGRAEAPIYAKAYVTLNGEDILSTAVVDMSLKDVVDEIAAVYYTFSDGQKASFDALYESDWFSGIAFTETLATKVTTAPEV